MVTRVDPFLGGLGIDATGKFEVQANATVTVGDGTSTGNVVIGGELVASTVSATTYTGLSANAITSSDTAVVVIDPNATIVTDGIERFRINSSGNVGIGTSSPAEKLSIETGASEYALQWSGPGDDWVLASSAGRAYIKDKTSAVEAISILNAGNVGIGTNNPSRPLHISASDCRIRLTDSDAPTISVELLNSSGSGILATNGASSLLFQTNNAERMRISSAGLVGIGTTNPLVKLTVSNGSGTGTALQVLTSGSGHNFDMVDGTGTARFRNVNGEMRLYGDLNTGGNGNIIFAPQGTTERMRIDSSGNVGIGTAAPSQKLTVEGTDARIYLTGANTDINMTGTADGQLSLDGNGFGFGIALNSSGANLYTNSASRDLIFGTDETERMRIDGSGNVGIGVSAIDTALGTKLHVAGTIRTDTGAANANPGIVFDHDNFADADANYIALDRTSEAMRFHINAAERMRITSVGNVGIGTAAPSYLLDLYRSASTVARILNSAATGGTPSTTHGEFVIESTDANMGMQFLGSTTANQRILFGDTDSGGSGQVIYDHTSNYMALSTNGSEAVRITSSGFVGIGTTAPSSLLHLASTDSAILTLEADTDNVTESHNARIELKQDGGAVTGHMGYATSSNGISIWNNYGDYVRFGTNNTERMHITSAGDVGIGTSSPTTKLHIASNGSTYADPSDNNLPTLYLHNTNNASINAHAILTLRTAGSSGGDPFISFDIAGEAGWALGVDNSDSNKFKISSSWTNVATNTELTLDNSGNLSVVGKLQEGGNSLIPPGSIIMYGAAAAPAGWYLCEGGAISRSTYAALFAVISTTYGVGDGSTTFNVPDFRDRAPYGASTFVLGSKTFNEVNALGQNATGTGTTGSTGGSTVANTTGAGGAHTPGVTTSTTNSTTDKDVTNAITVVTGVNAVAAHTHSVPSLTVNGHTHSVPSLTVTHPGVAVKFIIKT